MRKIDRLTLPSIVMSAAAINALGEEDKGVVLNYHEMPLDHLADTISGLHTGAANLAAGAKWAAKEALNRAWEAGRALNVAKARVPHGEWKQWLKLRVPKVSEDCACRYMKMAHGIPHMRNLEGIDTIRQAYLRTGVVKLPPEHNPREKKKPLSLTPKMAIRRMRTLRIWLQSLDFQSLGAQTGPLRREVEEMINILKTLEFKEPA